MARQVRREMYFKVEIESHERVPINTIDSPLTRIYKESLKEADTELECSIVDEINTRDSQEWT